MYSLIDKFMEDQQDMQWSERLNYVNENMSEHQRAMRELWIGDSKLRDNILYVRNDCIKCNKDFIPYPLNVKVLFETERICYTVTCNECINPISEVKKFFKNIGRKIKIAKLQLKGPQE